MSEARTVRRKRHAPATERNREPILLAITEIFAGFAPPVRVLEIGSGTGQHAAYFTAHRDWIWQPTELAEENLASIEAYREEAGANFLPPRRLDVLDRDWPTDTYQALFSANVVHISPWAVALAIVEGAARVLAPDGVLVLYGPFRFSGAFTAESNAQFDARLRESDPAWGVRDVDDLTRAALEKGFTKPEVRSTPANNHVLAYRRERR
jgi:SAM-dependent methyltransferase